MLELNKPGFEDFIFINFHIQINITILVILIYLI